MTTYVWGAANSDWQIAANWTPSGGPPTNGDTAQVDSSVTIGGTGSAAELDTTNQSGLVTLAGLFNIGTIFNGAAMALTGNITSSFIETFVDLNITGTVSAIGDPSATHEGIAQYNGTVDIDNGGTVDTSFYLIAYNPGSLDQPNANTMTIDGANGGASFDIATLATVDASDQIVGGFAITVAASVTVENSATLSTTYLSLEDPGAIMTVATAYVQVTQTSSDPSGVAGTSIQGGTLEVENSGDFSSTYLFQGTNAKSAFIVDNATATITAQTADAFNGLDIHDGSVFFRNDSTVSASQLFLGTPTDPSDTIGPGLTITSSTLDIPGEADVPDFSFSAIWLADGSTEIGKGSQVTTPALEVDSPNVGASTAPGNVVTIDGGSTVTVGSDVLIGVTDGSSSQVDVDGTDTQLLYARTLTVGAGSGAATGAKAQLFVTNGGFIGITDPGGAVGNLVAGGNTGDNGLVEVRDADSELSVADAIVGDAGSATMSVHGGGSVDISGTLLLGDTTTGNGLLALADTDGAGEVTADTLIVGNNGTGEAFFTSSDTTFAGTLTVTDTAYVGALAGSFGTIDATNGSLSVAGDLIVGDQGSGSVALDSTTVDIGGDLIIGNGGPSAFVALQDGALTLDGNLEVGVAGTGALALGSADASSTTLGNVVIGVQAGSDGEFVAHDPTTSLNIGTLVVGNLGNGTLDVFNAATVDVTDQSGIGVGDGSTGTVDLRAGEKFDGTAYPNAGSNILFDQNLVVGDAGDGSLLVGGETLQSDGADAQVKGDLIIGNQASAFGTVVVQNFFTPTGSAAVSSQLTVDSNIFVGVAATGKDDGSGGFLDGSVLQLLNAGVVDATADGAGLIDVAVSASSTGAVDVDSGTMNANTLVVGDGGSGILTIEDLGNVFVNNDVIVGNGANSVGAIDIDGTDGGATLQSGDNMVIGGAATAIVNGSTIGYPAILDATDGATVENAGTGDNAFIVGADAQSLGEAIIDGSTLDVTLADIGLDGSGVLTIRNGSTATFNDDLILGSGSAAFGGMDVNASEVDFFGAFDVGEVATGATINGTFIPGGLLTIENGATVLDQGNDGIDVGVAADSTGQMTVDNSDVEITSIVVGDEGAGTLTIQNSASLIVDPDQDVEIANAPGASGTVTVDGALLSFGSELDVGVGGNGSLSLMNGATAEPDATATDSDIVIGDDATASGTVTVDNSLLDPNDITIGNSGTGALTIQNGGTVITTGDADIASETSSSGTATLNGLGGAIDDTLWTIDGQLTVGDLGNGSLSINNGATMTAGDEFDVGGSNDGLGSTGQGTVTATGSNTLVESQSDLFIGADGNGTVEISLGAVLQADTGIVLGNGINAAGTLGISQASVTNGDAVDVGVQGTGDIEVNGGGDFNAGTVDVTLATTLLGKGTLDLTNLGGGNATAETGGLSIGSVGKGTVTVHGGSQLTTDGDAIIGDIGTGGALIEGINANPTLAPSTWNITGGLSIGGTSLAGGGIGTLTVANGGAVHVAGVVTMWSKGSIVDNGATPGLIEIGGTIASDSLTGAVIDAAIAATSTTVASPAGTLIGGGTVAANILDNGLIDTTNRQTLTVTGNVTGSGVLALDGASALILQGSVAATNTIEFNNPGTVAEVLALRSPVGVAATIVGMGAGDAIDLTSVPFAGTGFSVAGDVLTVTNGGGTVASLALGGTTYSTSDFSLHKDGSGKAEIEFGAGPSNISTPAATLPVSLPAFPGGFDELLAGANGVYLTDPNAPFNSTYTLTVNDQTGLLFFMPGLSITQSDNAGATPVVLTGSLDDLNTDLNNLVYTPSNSATTPPDTITLQLVRGDGATLTSAIGYDPGTQLPQIVDTGATTVALDQVLPLTLVPSDPFAANIGEDSFVVSINTSDALSGVNFGGYLVGGGVLNNGGFGAGLGGSGVFIRSTVGGTLSQLAASLSGGSLLFIPTATGTQTIDGQFYEDNSNTGASVTNYSFTVNVTAAKRTTPETDIWTAAVSTLLSDPGNWSNAAAPETIDTAAFAPIANVQTITTSGNGVASNWDVNASTSFAGVIDATGASGDAAFDVDKGATASFTPGSDLYAGALVNNPAGPSGPSVDTVGNQVIVGDTGQGTLVLNVANLSAGETTIANTNGAGGSRISAVFSTWTATGNIMVGANAFGMLDLMVAAVTGQTQMLVGLNNSLGIVVEFDDALRLPVVVGDGGSGEAVLSAAAIVEDGGPNDTLDISAKGRLDLAAGSSVSASPSEPIDNDGVISGDDWRIGIGTVFNLGTLTNNGTIEATAGAGPAVLAGLDLEGNGTLLIDAGGTLELSSNTEADNGFPVAVAPGQTVVFQPEFNGIGGLLNIQDPTSFFGLIEGFGPGELLEIDDASTTVQSATYSAGSNITSVTFAFSGNTTAIAFAGSLTVGNFVLDANQPASAALFDYAVAGLADQPPVLSGPTDIAATDNVANAIPGLSLSDADAARLNQTITLTLTANNGKLSATKSTNATIGGSGTGTLSIVGALAAVQGDLASIGFTPQPQSDSTIIVTATDGITTTPATLSILAHEQQPFGPFFTGTANYVYAGPQSDNFGDPTAWQDTSQKGYVSAPGIADSATIAADPSNGFEDVIGGVGVAGQLLTEGAVVLTGSLTLPGLGGAGIGTPIGPGPAFNGALKDASGILVLAAGFQMAAGGDVTVQGELDSAADRPWSTTGNLDINGGTVRLGGLGTVTVGGTVSVSGATAIQGGELDIAPGELISAGGVVGATAGGGLSVVNVAGPGTWTSTGALTVGRAGDGAMTLTTLGGGTALVSAPSVTIGASPGASGTVSALGQSTLAVGSQLIVGDGGTGTLIVTEGIADTGGAPGIATVGSPGTLGELDIGTMAGGTGIVEVSEPGTLTVDGSAFVGGTSAGPSGGSGTLVVAGDTFYDSAFGSGQVNVTGSLVVDANGTVLLRDGVLGIGGATVAAGGMLSGDGLIAAAGVPFANFTDTAPTPDAPLTSVLDNGVVEASVNPANSASTLTIYGPVAGTGTLDIAAGATLVVEGSVAPSVHVAFLGAGGVLALAQPAAFGPTIDGLVNGDELHLPGIAPGTIGYDATTGTLTDTTPGQVYQFTFDPPSGQFAAVSDAHDGTLVTFTGTVALPAMLSGTLANIGVVDETPLTPLAGLTVTDPGAGDTDTVTITLANPDFGTLSNLDGGSYNGTTGVYTVSGTPGAVTTAIDGLRLTPTTPGANVFLTSTAVTLTVAGPGGGPAAQNAVDASVQQVLGLASVPVGDIAISVSADGTGLAASTADDTNEAAVTSPTTGDTYLLPAGYQAEYLGGNANATLQDTLVGGAVLVGNTGADVLIGAANDSIVAGNGNNTLQGGSGTVALVVGAGNDSITTSANSTDAVTLGGGTDTVLASGSGTITGGAGSDLIDASGTGPSAADLIVSQGLNGTVLGGTGDLAVLDEGTHSSVLGGAGSLTLLDDGAHDTIQGGAGTTNVTLSGTFGRTRGGTGNFTVDDPTGNSTVIGPTADAMFVTVGAGASKSDVFGRAGNTDILDLGADALMGSGDGTSVVSIAGANAQLYGSGNGSGTLNVSIGAANALVFGLGDNATVDASSAAATGALVFGGFSSVPADNGPLLVQGGQDFLVAITGGSNSTINAGTGGLYAYIGTGSLAGSTVINAASASALYVAFIGGAGSATVFGGEAAASVFGVDGTDATYVNSLAGAPGAYLVANGSAAGGETLNAAGSATNDSLFAAAGNVSLVAGPGSDLLSAGGNTGSIGGAGTVVGGDTLMGSTTGTDLMLFAHGAFTGGAVVINFSSADTVFLAGYNAAAGGDQAGTALQGAMETGGNTTIALADGTHITFVDATAAELQGHVFSN